MNNENITGSDKKLVRKIRDLLSLIDVKKLQEPSHKWFLVGQTLHGEYSTQQKGLDLWIYYMNLRKLKSHTEAELTTLYESFTSNKNSFNLESLYQLAMKNNVDKYIKYMSKGLRFGNINNPNNTTYFNRIDNKSMEYARDVYTFLLDTVVVVNDGSKQVYYLKVWNAKSFLDRIDKLSGKNNDLFEINNDSDEESNDDSPYRDPVELVEVSQKKLYELFKIVNNIKNIPLKVYFERMLPLLTYKSINYIPFPHKRIVDPNTKLTILNTFKGFNVWSLRRSCTPSKLDQILYHISAIICSNNNNLYDYVIRWFAHIVQKPDVKMNVCLQFHPNESYPHINFFNPLCDGMFGANNVYYLDCNQILSFDKVCSCVQNKILAVYDGSDYEVVLDDSTRELFTRLVTENKLTSTKTNQMVDNYCNYIIIGNFVAQSEQTNDNYLSIPSSDNGYDVEYAKSLIKALTKNTVIDLFHYLKEIDLTGWDPKVLPNILK